MINFNVLMRKLKDKQMKNISIYLLLAVTVFGLHGCNKQLDALPQNSKIDKIVILDQGTAQIALNGVYYAFANANRTKTDWLKHQILPGMLTGYLGYGYGQEDHEENRNNKLSDYWAESYVLLNTANGVIKGINDLPDNKFAGNKKKEMLAEARFLRAYAHFKLLSYYGQWFKLDSPLGVLLRDELSTLSNINKARSSVKDSYDFILEDLNYAVTNGPEENEKFYATKWAAMLLKMRVLMSRGQAADYTQVIDLADDVIAGPYVLEDNPKDIFHTKGMSSDEVILAIQPQVNQELDYYSKSAKYWPGASSLYVAKRALLNLLEDDPRLDWMIGSESEEVDSAPDTYYFAKYYKENTAPSQLSETDYAMRLTEVYLLKAEAIARSNGSLNDAKNLVHLIQSKSDVTATTNTRHYLDVANAANKDDLLVEIYKETARSLVAEDGMEWLALLRLPLVTITSLKPTLQNEMQFIFPVPVSEFRYNPSFGDQNPGYPKN